MISPIQAFLEKIHQRHATNRDGTVADYIPELSKMNPDLFGICLATTDGQVYEVGDSRHFFTIQSISKPFVYGIALEDKGREAVLAKVGVEPTGDAFNSISLDPETGQPANPMINAGAIATTGLVEGSTSDEKISRILASFSRYTGRDLTIDEAVYHSEAETGHRNRAISHLLRNFNIIETDPEPSLDAYFRQCSINVTCRDLAIMAATLANNGINPQTGVRAVRADCVENILGVMSSCGMYDYAGEWIYRVGLPSKSGVGGGIVAVLPGRLGIGIFSPPLDRLGNSVRGIQVCEDLSREGHLHMFRVDNTTASVIRRSFDATTINSNRLRPPWEADLLRREGKAIRVLEVQGEIVFSSVEKIIREILSESSSTTHVILSFRHALSLNDTSSAHLLELWKSFQADGRHLLFVELSHLPQLSRYFETHLDAESFARVRFATDLDRELEWAESELLRAHGRLPANQQRIKPEAFILFRDFTPDEISQIKTLLQKKSYREGEGIIRAGDTSAELFFLQRGKVSVVLELKPGHVQRLATYSPGMAFGEVALLDRSPRSASVLADSEVECLVLGSDDFDHLTQTQPQLMVKLLRNIALEFSLTLRKSNRMLQMYSK
jgi:glutaminase